MKYSAKKDYKKILDHNLSTKKLYRRLVAEGIINPKIQMKEIKKLFNETQ
jgi:hypothetical protein